MSRLEASLEQLHHLRHPSDLTFTRDGTAVVAAVRPEAREARQSYQTRIWRFPIDGVAEQLTEGPNADDLPRCSPVDDRVAFASDRTIAGKMTLHILDSDGSIRSLGDIPGTVEDIRWQSDGSAIVVLAADRGLDGGATNGAQRLTWGEEEDPEITNADARRRLFKVDTRDGATTEVGPRDLSVWEFDFVGNAGALALVSADASERGWHRTELAQIDFAARSAKTLYRPTWQLQALAVDPAGKRVAFIENWSSDRGLVSGEISVLDLSTLEVTTFAPDGNENISSIAWRDDESLWFAGWSGLGSVYGVTRLDGSVEWIEREDAAIGPNTFTAGISPAPDNVGFAAIREYEEVPPEVVYRPAPTASWVPLTDLNGVVARDYPAYPEVRTVSWKGEDGLDLEGIVLLPRDREPGPQPMIVDIHGGPSWASKHAFDPGYGLLHAAAGFVVFLPNYRGNAGWGKDFGRMNIGDPGGTEFQDILDGVDWCIAEALADPDRIGVTGGSYGGYMTAWAVATTNRFRAAVMVSGIANQLSSHYSCNHAFHDFINGGPLTEAANREVALDRSPLMRLDRPTTPTLIIHGEGDRCTPLGQAQEFYAALVECGVEAEMVVYPREGHGLQERGHQVDAWRRTAAWFNRHLRDA